MARYKIFISNIATTNRGMFRSLRHNNGGAGGAVCWLFNPRAFYRWVQCPIDKGHGGGGGLNKVTENEIRRVIRIAERFPQFRCRRIAYSLERAGVVYIGKTRIAQILKENGLNHEFVRQRPKPDIPPDDYLKHDPASLYPTWYHGKKIGLNDSWA